MQRMVRLEKWVRHGMVVGILFAAAMSFGHARVTAGQTDVTPVASNLDNPCGVAIQPGTGDIFVSTHPAIVRLVAGEEGYRTFVEIQGFATDVYGKGPKYEIGPLGLAFLDKKTLIVGGGENKDGEEVVRFYAVGALPRKPSEPLLADAMIHQVGPIKRGPASAMGEGNFFGIAVQASDIFVTCNGDDTKGWIAKIAVKDGCPGLLTPFIPTKVETEVDAPAAATISPEGKLIVSQFGEINVPGDALLTYYDPKTGALERRLTTGLHDLIAIAFHPKSGKLYGIDFAWMAPDRGALYLLEPGEEEVATTRIATLDKGTAMAFASDGTLFVSALGSAKEPMAGQTKDFPGKVFKITGLD